MKSLENQGEQQCPAESVLAEGQRRVHRVLCSFLPICSRGWSETIRSQRCRAPDAKSSRSQHRTSASFAPRSVDRVHTGHTFEQPQKVDEDQRAEKHAEISLQSGALKASPLCPGSANMYRLSLSVHRRLERVAFIVQAVAHQSLDLRYWRFSWRQPSAAASTLVTTPRLIIAPYRPELQTRTLPDAGDEHDHSRRLEKINLNGPGDVIWDRRCGMESPSNRAISSKSRSAYLVQGRRFVPHDDPSLAGARPVSCLLYTVLCFPDDRIHVLWTSQITLCRPEQTEVPSDAPWRKDSLLSAISPIRPCLWRDGPYLS